MRPEFPGSHDVGHGLTVHPAPQQRIEAIEGPVIKDVFGMCEQIAARHVYCPAEKDLGIQPCCVTDGRETSCRRVQHNIDSPLVILIHD